jgi:hypothetical protein
VLVTLFHPAQQNQVLGSVAEKIRVKMTPQNNQWLHRMTHALYSSLEHLERYGLVPTWLSLHPSLSRFAKGNNGVIDQDQTLPPSSISIPLGKAATALFSKEPHEHSFLVSRYLPWISSNDFASELPFYRHYQELVYQYNFLYQLFR